MTKYIEKDFQVKIIDYEGLKQTLTETYTCDKCKNIFKVKANIE